MLDYKRRISIVFIILANCCYAQKTLKNFEGELLFKESYYYFALTRTTYDTAHLYYNYEVKKTININKYFPISSYDADETPFLPIIFCKNEDSLFFKYQEKYSNVPDTVVTKLFPLSYKDTIEVPFCYRISQDSVRWKDTKRTLEIKTDCDGDGHDIKTYRLKDTSFIFKEYTSNHYIFYNIGIYIFFLFKE